METTIRDILFREVSVFSGANGVNPIKDMKLGNFLRLSAQYKDQILKCREIYAREGKSEAYKEEKKKLPSATCSATFTYRNKDNVKKKSNLIVMDIDGIHTDVEIFKSQIIGIKWVAMVQASVSGDGVWVLVPYEEGLDHDEVWDSVASDFSSMGITVDANSRGIGRLRFISWDPNTLYKRTPIQVYGEKLRDRESVKQEEPRQELHMSTQPSSVTPVDDLLADDRFCFAAAWHAITAFGYVTNTSNNMHDWLGQLSTFSTLGANGLKLALELSRRSSGYVSDAEVEKTFKNMAKNNTSSRKYFTRYFACCKEALGDNWISRIKESYQKS